MKTILQKKSFKIAIISFLVVTVFVVSMYTIYQKIKADVIQNTVVYVISGEDQDYITLHKGMIMVLPDKEALIGGDVVFHKELLQVEYMSLSYYYMEQGKRTFSKRILFQFTILTGGRTLRHRIQVVLVEKICLGITFQI